VPRRSDRDNPAFQSPLHAMTLSAIGIVALVYLLQCLSPLRLSEDAVRYLLISNSIAEGRLVGINGVPPGYPAFVALLDRLNLATSVTLTFANCVFLAIGLLPLRHLFNARQAGIGNLVVLIAMLSWLIVRLTPTPAAEPMYMAFSFGALYLMERSTLGKEPRRPILFLAGAAIATAIAIATRVAGFALIPPLAMAAFGSWKASSAKTGSAVVKSSWITLFLLLAIVTTSVLVLAGSLPKYPRELVFTYVTDQSLQKTTAHFLALFSTFGSVVINLPLTRFHSLILPLAATGLAAALLIFRLVQLRAPTTPLGIYLVTSVIILILWPNTADRLWAPVSPVIAGYLLVAAVHAEKSRWASVKRIYLAWFLVAGSAALAYSTRITFSGNQFSRAYGRAGGNSVGFSRTTGFGEWNDSMVVMLRRKYERF
jgi:hypothetical protein